MNITYTIDSDNAIRIFDGVNPEPFIFQPHHPDGAEFTAETAETWAEEFIVEWNARQAEDAARAEAKASAEAKLTALGLTSDEVAAIIGR